MFSLIVLTVSALAVRKTIGPCFLYDRYCFESIWQGENSTTEFGTDFLNNNWRVTPELHSKKCFGVPQCNVSGYAFACRSFARRNNKTEFYKKAYVLVDNRTVADDYLATFDDPNAANFCVTVDADVKSLQGKFEEGKRVEPEDVDDGAVLISNISNMKKAENCNTTQWLDAPTIDVLTGGAHAAPVLLAMVATVF